MERTSSVSTRIAFWLLAALFAVNVYRAAAQSFTTDESFSYIAFIEPALRHMWTLYDANNHVLNSLLAKLSVAVFGLSEFTVRLPSVLGGGLYLAGVWAVCRRILGSGPLFLAGAALLSLNPLLLDYLSAARGYGMAMACWMWALALLLDCLEPDTPARTAKLPLAAACLALCVSANLAFLFPAAALAAVFAALWVAGRGRSWNLLADRFAVPGVVLAFLILVMPVSHFQPGNLYYGTRDLWGAFEALADLSLLHDGSHPPYIVLLRQAAFILTVMVMAGAGVSVAAILRRGAKTRLETFLLLEGATLFVTLAGTVATHYLLHMPYPRTRTALYWIPLLTLAGMAVVRWRRSRALTAAALGLSVLCAGAYLYQFQTRGYGEWMFESGAKRVARVLRKEAGNRPVRVAASFPVDLTMKFYTRRLRLRSVQVERLNPQGTWDFYVLLPGDAKSVEQARLKVLYRDGDLVLARP